jgi:hypothetical protein
MVIWPFWEILRPATISASTLASDGRASIFSVFQGVGKRKMLLDASAVYPFKDMGRMPATIHGLLERRQPECQISRPFTPDLITPWSPVIGYRIAPISA